MKVKPFKEEVIQLVLQFLQKELGQVQIVNKLREKHMQNLPKWVLNHNRLIDKGLTKIIKSFVQMDKNIKQYYIKRKPVAEEKQEQVIEKEPKISEQKNKRPRKKSANETQQQSKPQKKNTKIQAPKEEKVESHSENTSTWVKNMFQPPKKLQQIGKDYGKNKPAAVKKPSMIAKEASSQESSDRPLHSDHSESQQKKQKLKKKTKKAAKKQSSSQQSEEQQQQVKKPVKKQKKIVKQQKKVAAKKQSSSQQSEEQQIYKPVKKQKKIVKQQKKEEKELEKVEVKVAKKIPNKVQTVQQPQRMRTRSIDMKQQQQAEEKPERNGYKNTSYTSFSRIKLDQVGPIPQKLRDNSFQAKFKYGKGGDQWGRYGHQKLKDTRGDSFKKTKDKLKNRAFQGANIDFNVINSIPLE